MTKTKTFLTTLFLFSSIAFSAYASSPLCEHRIIFLPQTHNDLISDNATLDPSSTDDISRSQFQIAHYLLKKRDVPVFSEQIDKTMSLKGIDPKRIEEGTKEWRDLFPNGIPSHFRDLTQAQKEKLAKAGADLTMLMLQKIDTLHQIVESREVQDELFSKVRKMHKELKQKGVQNVQTDSPYWKLAFDQREILALQEINKFFQKNPTTRDVILIYGSLHDFSRHPNVFPPECVIVPYEFQSSHLGKNISQPTNLGYGAQ